MGTKEFRKLNKAELLEVIYRMQLQEQAQAQQAEIWKAQAQERYDTLTASGSIAEAALSIHHVFTAAQQAADDYVSTVSARADEKLRRAQEGIDQLLALLAELESKPILQGYRERLAQIREAIAPTGETL